MARSAGGRTPTDVPLAEPLAGIVGSLEPNDYVVSHGAEGVRLAGLPMQATSKAADPAVMDLSPHHTELVAPRVNHACAVRAASIDARGPECHQTLDFGVNS